MVASKKDAQAEAYASLGSKMPPCPRKAGRGTALQLQTERRTGMKRQTSVMGRLNPHPEKRRVRQPRRGLTKAGFGKPALQGVRS
jgi:hypothetical protein